MRVDILYPTLPPALNGIGDHTAHLARALTELSCDVRILTAQSSWTPLPDVQVLPCFQPSPRRSILSVADAVAAHPPDVLLVQFEQFSYGRWGLNPFLPWVIARIRRAHPHVRVALMAHEDFISASNVRTSLMSVWQRAQLFALGRLSDIVFFSIELWALRYGRGFQTSPSIIFPSGPTYPSLRAARRPFGPSTELVPTTSSSDFSAACTPLVSSPRSDALSITSTGPTLT